MKIGRLYVQKPLHGRGLCIEWECRLQPGDPPWTQRWRFLRIYFQ